MKRLIFYLIFFSILFIAPLLFLELGLRIFYPQPLGAVMFTFDPELGQVPTPRQRAVRTMAEDSSYTATNDELGFRIVQDAVAPSTNESPILVIGDSFTYGVGVNDNQTFASQLTTQSRVINAGNPGVGTDYVLKFLHTRATRLSPALIVVGFFPNDFADNDGARYYRLEADSLIANDISEKFAFYKKKSFLVNSIFYQWGCSHSHLLSFFRRAGAWIATAGTIGNLNSFLKNRPDYTGLERGFSNEGSILMTRLLFAEIQKQSKLLGARLLVAYIPSYVDLRSFRATKAIQKDEKAFRKIMQDLRLDWISFTSELANSTLSLNELYLNEGHWSAAAHRIAAAQLVKHLGLSQH